MMITQSIFRVNSEIVRDGEYYVCSKQKGDKIRLGYIYKTWCGSPCGTYMSFSAVEIGKPLSLIKIGNSQYDQGQLKTFSFDSRNLALVDDVYNRSISWIKNLQRELKYPQLDESVGCTPAVIVVNQGILSAFYGREDFLKAYFEAFEFRL